MDTRLPGGELRVARVEIAFLGEDPLLRLGEPALAILKLLLPLRELLRAPAALLVALREGAAALVLAGAEIALALCELLLEPNGLLLALLERAGAALRLGRRLCGAILSLGLCLLGTALGLREGFRSARFGVGNGLARPTLRVAERLRHAPFAIAHVALAALELLLALAGVLLHAALCLGESLLQPGQLLFASGGRRLLLGQLGLELGDAPALFLERLPLRRERPLTLGDVGFDLGEAGAVVVELRRGLGRLVVLAQLALIGLDLLGERLLQVELTSECGRQLATQLLDVRPVAVLGSGDGGRRRRIEVHTDDRRFGSRRALGFAVWLTPPLELCTEARAETAFGLVLGALGLRLERLLLVLRLLLWLLSCGHCCLLLRKSRRC